MSNCTQLSPNLPIGKHQTLSDTLTNSTTTDNQSINSDHLLSFSEKLACTLYSLTQQQQTNQQLINQQPQQLNSISNSNSSVSSLFHNNLSPTTNNMHSNHNCKLLFSIDFNKFLLD